jgi:anaerobic magnesium-protoporphyrin IX monomethyl ester cyclase
MKGVLSMRVHLIFPPHFPADIPYLSLPALAAYTEHDIVCHDVNLALWHILLSEDYLSDKVTHELAQKGEKAKKILKSEEAFDIFKYIEAIISVETVLNALSERFPVTIGWREYRVDPALYDIKSLATHIQKGYIDAFGEPFETYCLDNIVRESPDIIGFSIVVPHQLVPSMEMAQTIKKDLPDTRIVFGGPYMTHLSVFDDAVQYLLQYCDLITLFEGEKSLAHVLEHKRGTPLDKVPNSIYWDDGIKKTDLHFIDSKDIPLPQYDCLPLDQYLSPRLVLPYLTSRGCYWHSCKFCPLHFSFGNGFRELPVERVVQDIKRLKSKYNLEYLSFVDLSLNPERALNISEALTREGITMNMKANMRFEQGLDSALFKTLRGAGFRVLSFGMESYNNRVLQAMNKGTTQQTIKKTLEASTENDIWNNLYFMTGFPTETEEEIRNTQKFITENPHLIGTADHTLFELYYPALQNCEELLDNVVKPTNVFGLSYNYTPKGGVYRERASELDAEIEAEIRKVLPDHWIAQTLSDDMVLLYVDKYGKGNISQAAL